MHAMQAAPYLPRPRPTHPPTQAVHSPQPHPTTPCRFVTSPEGAFFREFITDELVKSIDALSRDQLARLVLQLGLQGTQLPVFLPGSRVRSLPLAPSISDEDRQVVDNVAKLVAFLAGGSPAGVGGEEGAGASRMRDPAVLRDLLPVLPTVAGELVPEVTQRLVSRITARFVRELYV
jgi:aarF domain-containing kinase